MTTNTIESQRWALAALAELVRPQSKPRFKALLQRKRAEDLAAKARMSFAIAKANLEFREAELRLAEAHLTLAREHEASLT